MKDQSKYTSVWKNPTFGYTLCSPFNRRVNTLNAKSNLKIKAVRFDIMGLAGVRDFTDTPNGESTLTPRWKITWGVEEVEIRYFPGFNQWIELDILIPNKLAQPVDDQIKVDSIDAPNDYIIFDPLNVQTIYEDRADCFMRCSIIADVAEG
ncbi:MAG: hypothetical protein R3356_02305 [Eudoraea sp.]|nr:hypothetical protein [Eudoraea sp.]